MSSEIRKSSFYVLFLGAKESQGLRGSNYIEPVLQYFVSQEHRMQALKVTLQLSPKGLRIIPSNLKLSPHGGNGIIVNGNTSLESQTEKHFIPHHAITCVFQGAPPNDDVVSCILLIYNPDTKCPVHVHCYRCDSPETATILREQFESLVNREENQRKFKDIEAKLQSKGLLPRSGGAAGGAGASKVDQFGVGLGEFDCRKSDSSENSDRGFGSGGSGSSAHTTDRIAVATLYDSLAAELREKLSIRKANAPLLLPPRDYDTVHRQRGNLIGVDGRRCSNPAIVGANRRERRSYTSREQDSCGRSSGIGSAEDNCSPVHDPLVDGAVPSSSDDEDWNSNHVVVTESSQYLVRPIWPPSPKIGRRAPNSPLPPPLPKRPEFRQRTPEMGTSTPPAPVFSRERFEGVRQKWEKLDHQYVKQLPKQIHGAGAMENNGLDDGFRSREAAEADYRRQLSRESLLRSVTRPNKVSDSKDSLDRWVESGIRSPRGVWRKLEEESPSPPPVLGASGCSGGAIGTGRNGRNYFQESSTSVELPMPRSPASKLQMSGATSSMTRRLGEHSGRNTNTPLLTRTATNISCSRLNESPKRVVDGKTYRELNDHERFPGLDRETARTSLHTSNLNLSQQHIYSEPSYETSLLVPPTQNGSKTKKFSLAFWKN